MGLKGEGELAGVPQWCSGGGVTEHRDVFKSVFRMRWIAEII